MALIVLSLGLLGVPAFAQDPDARAVEDLRIAFERNGCVMSDDPASAAALRAMNLDSLRIGPAIAQLLKSGDIVAEPDGLKLVTGLCKR